MCVCVKALPTRLAIKMFHSCFGTDWFLIGQSGITLGFSCVLVCVYVYGRLSKSAVNLGTGKQFVLVSKLLLLTSTFGTKSYSYPDWADVFEEFSHLLQVCLLSQPCDVNCAVLGVILLFRASCNRLKNSKYPTTQFSTQHNNVKEL